LKKIASLARGEYKAKSIEVLFTESFDQIDYFTPPLGNIF
jgi:hypothetical protein